MAKWTVCMNKKKSNRSSQMCVKRQRQLDRQRNGHQVIKKSTSKRTHTHTSEVLWCIFIVAAIHLFFFHTWCWYTRVISCTLSLTFRLWTPAIPAQAFSEIMHPHFVSSAAQEWLLSVCESLASRMAACNKADSQYWLCFGFVVWTNANM